VRERVDCFGLSHAGLSGAENEDQFLIADLLKSVYVRQTSLDTVDRTRLTAGPRAHLFLVADGVGGAGGGRLASGLTVRTLTRYVLTAMPFFPRRRPGRTDELYTELAAALKACRRAVGAAASGPGLDRMSSTLTLAYVRWPRLYIVHAGDSRAYLARGGRLRRLTHDHTVAQGMVDRGSITQAEADDSRWSRVLTRCITGTADVVADVRKTILRPGDTLLLCTDGLTRGVSDEEIANLLPGGRAEGAANRLIAAANDAGGEDNVTAVVVRFPRARN
jgi:protein phosphatase